MIQPILPAPRGGLTNRLRAAWPRDPVRRRGTLLVLGLCLYAVAFAGWLLWRWLSGLTGEVPAWALMLPPQAATAFVVWGLLSDRRLDRARRAGWCCVLAAAVVDMLAIVDWSYLVSATGQPYGTWADVLYMLNYGLLTAALAAFFVSCGGSFLRPRVWIDAATLLLGAIAALLPFLSSPLLSPAAVPFEGLGTTMSYSLGIAITGTIALLLFMQVMDWRSNAAMLLVLLGVGTDLGTDVMAVAANVRGQFHLGNFDDLGYCWSYVWIAMAALAEQRRGQGAEHRATPEGNVHAFLPVVAILVSIAILLGASMRRADFSLLTGAVLLAVGGALLVVRQLGVRHEVRRLNSALAMRAADARLTELVRRSADMIAVVSSDGRVSYASPAARSVLGQEPEALVGIDVTQLLGTASEGRLWAVLNDARRHAHEPVEVELAYQPKAGEPKTLHVTGSNEIANPLIGGFVLTVRDVTEQRATEREVLEIASRERLRMSGEVHEGIGQDLTGIALMLKSLATSTNGDARTVRESLGTIVEEVNRTVGSVRALARGLSPLGVVRGSLVSALRSLAADVEDRHRIPVRLRCEPTALEGTTAAEHLYYIAHEAVSRAVRRRYCTRVDVDLRAASTATVLSVSDDALGGSADEEAADLLPNRLMGYRARLIGGTLRIVRRVDAGSYVEVTVPTFVSPPPR